MTKKKPSNASDIKTDPNDNSSAISDVSPNLSGRGKQKAPEQSPGITISRNKHWRFISAYHGPWLQLPPEILETLCHSNYLSPRPRQTEPGTLYDLLKIRRLVDEASDLAVRAQNGTASSALANDNSLPGAALGLTFRGGSANAKLSPERKFRMRELAVQKLSQAYRLDEIAASVATMQGASALDTVGSFVLQRAPNSLDAQYVHFFHEKIPSRMMAECTPLAPLNHIVASEPGHAAPCRTRAIAKIFKEDHVGAIEDLTEALHLCRLEQAKHRAGKGQLVTMATAKAEAEKRKTWSRDWLNENRVAEEDQPKGLELQLLFQRGNQSLALACRVIRKTLRSFEEAHNLREQNCVVNDDSQSGKSFNASKDGQDIYTRAIGFRELVRKHAKRAQRDFVAFFNQLDYSFAENDAYFRMYNPIDDDYLHGERVIEDDGVPLKNQSTAVIKHPFVRSDSEHSSRDRMSWSPPPPPVTYTIAEILNASPPQDLPPFPPTATQQGSYFEIVTYHPLLPETLHLFLLTHALLQTPPTTLNRLASNVARLSRLTDGYPFFLSSRSPSRADWTEILRKTRNWIGLSGGWELLCKPPNSQVSADNAWQNARQSSKTEKAATKTKPATARDLHEETAEQKEERIHQDAVMEALGDDRVVDDDTFRKSVQARKNRAWQDELGNGNAKAIEINQSCNKSNLDLTSTSKVEKDDEYLIGTERAEAIADWVLEAPSLADVPATKAKKGKKRRTGAAHVETLREGQNLETSVSDLQLD